jgi:hypothetical protein
MTAERILFTLELLRCLIAAARHRISPKALHLPAMEEENGHAGGSEEFGVGGVGALFQSDSASPSR